MSVPVTNPFSLFTDVDGDSLENGYIYIGTANLNPQSNPIQAYWDTDLTIPAAQPIRTVNGYPSRNGTAAQIFVPGEYSIIVKNKNDALVFSQTVPQSYLNDPSGQAVHRVDTIADLKLYPIPTNDGFQVQLGGYYAIGDGGSGPVRSWRSGQPAGTYVDNGGSIILPTGGDGSGAWVWDWTGDLDLRWFGAVGEDYTKDMPAFTAAMALGKPIYSTAVYVELSGTYNITAGTILKNIAIKLRSAVASTMVVDASQKWENVIIDANGNQYAVKERYSPGQTFGLKYSTFRSVLTTGATVADWYLRGYHFLTQWDNCRATSVATGANVAWEVNNDDGIPTPDMAWTQCYSIGPSRGYDISLASAVFTSCAADFCTLPPFSGFNSFIVMNGCSAESMDYEMAFPSSLVKISGGFFQTSAGATYHDQGSGTYSFISTASGTYEGNIVVDTSTFKNAKSLNLAVIRAYSNPSGVLLRACQLSNIGAGTIRQFYYSSAGSPSTTQVATCASGISSTNVEFAGIDPTGSTLFTIYNAYPSTIWRCPHNSTIRYISWREFGANTAGASTVVAMKIFNSDGTLASTTASVISIAGAGSGTAQRSGTTILDVDILQGQYIVFEVTSGGERINTGIAISAVIDHTK